MLDFILIQEAETKCLSLFSWKEKEMRENHHPELTFPDLSKTIQNNLNMDMDKVKICNLVCWILRKVAIER